MSTSHLRPARRASSLQRLRPSEGGCKLGRGTGRAEASREVPNQNNGAGVTVLKIGSTRLLIAGSVRLEEAGGRKRALWNRADSRSPGQRAVGLLLRPPVDVSEQGEGSRR
jgi:hypothetical protein